MHRHLRFLSIVSLAAAALCQVVVTAFHGIASLARDAWDVVASAAAPPRDLFASFMPYTPATGTGIDAALYQRNRHEAGVSRRSAARNV